MRVLIAIPTDDETEVASLVENRGLRTVGSVEVVRGRRLVAVATSGPAEAARLVAELRRAGHMAVARAVGPGHDEAWARHTAPVWFAPGACVCPPWSDCGPVDADVVVEIDPYGGFGAGSHPTTVMVLGAVASLVRPGDRVLDLGCGSGVVAVLAARLGARVSAVDVDRRARRATATNASLNGVELAVEAELTAPPGGFAVVAANIHAHTLIELAPAVLAVLAPRRGTLVLSGISAAQQSAVVAAYAPLPVVSVERSDEWICLILGEGVERDPVARATPASS